MGREYKDIFILRPALVVGVAGTHHFTRCNRRKTAANFFCLIVVEGPGAAKVLKMSVELDHLIVPTRDRKGAAELLATLLGVSWAESGVGPFCPVYVNEGLTLDFDQADGPFPVQHYCFRVSETELDGILTRLEARGVAFRSTPHGPVDMQVNTQHGGRIVYWNQPDEHVWEALTVSYARQPREGNAT